MDDARVITERARELITQGQPAEAEELLRQVQRPNGIAVVGHALGESLVASGDHDTAQPILQFALAAASQIGHADLASQISQLLQSRAAGEDA